MGSDVKNEKIRAIGWLKMCSQDKWGLRDILASLDPRVFNPLACEWAFQWSLSLLDLKRTMMVALLCDVVAVTTHKILSADIWSGSENGWPTLPLFDQKSLQYLLLEQQSFCNNRFIVSLLLSARKLFCAKRQLAERVYEKRFGGTKIVLNFESKKVELRHKKMLLCGKKIVPHRGDPLRGAVFCRKEPDLESGLIRRKPEGKRLNWFFIEILFPDF